MKFGAYCIYDSKAHAYLKPFFMPNDAMAVRAFTQIANDPQSDICRSPADFTLFKVGVWDDESGGFAETAAAASLANALHLKETRQ